MGRDRPSSLAVGGKVNRKRGGMPTNDVSSMSGIRIGGKNCGKKGVSGSRWGESTREVVD